MFYLVSPAAVDLSVPFGIPAGMDITAASVDPFYFSVDAISPIPEPTSSIWLVTGAMLLIRRRRHKSVQ